MANDGALTSPQGDMQGCMTHLSWDEATPRVLETVAPFAGIGGDTPLGGMENT
jgi:hypothetical protein